MKIFNFFKQPNNVLYVIILIVITLFLFPDILSSIAPKIGVLVLYFIKNIKINDQNGIFFATIFSATVGFMAFMIAVVIFRLQILQTVLFKKLKNFYKLLKNPSNKFRNLLDFRSEKDIRDFMQNQGVRTEENERIIGSIESIIGNEEFKKTDDKKESLVKGSEKEIKEDTKIFIYACFLNIFSSFMGLAFENDALTRIVYMICLYCSATIFWRAWRLIKRILSYEIV